MAQKPSFW